MPVKYSIEKPGRFNAKLKLTTCDPEGKPSWKRYYDGEVLAGCYFMARGKGKYGDGFLELCAYETATPNDSTKRGSTKEVHVTMNAKQAIALRDHLNEVFPKEEY